MNRYGYDSDDSADELFDNAHADSFNDVAKIEIENNNTEFKHNKSDNMLTKLYNLHIFTGLYT
jgi:hypothetical protein